MALPLKRSSSLGADLRDRAFGCEVSAQDDEVAVFFDRLVERLNDGLPGGIRLHIGERLRHGLAGDGEGVAVEEAGVERTWFNLVKLSNLTCVQFFCELGQISRSKPRVCSIKPRFNEENVRYSGDVVRANQAEACINGLVH